MDDAASDQIRHLKRELEFARQRSLGVPDWARVLALRVQELRWTLNRWAGRGHLQDGVAPSLEALRAVEDIAIPATIAQPTPRLFFDMTRTYGSAYRTGIQRVTRAICQTGVAENLACPIIEKDGRFLSLTDLQPAPFTAGDRIILFDASWINTRVAEAALAGKAAGAEIILGLYDTTPLDLPGYTAPTNTETFAAWLRALAPQASALVAISRSAAEDFADWAPKLGLAVDALPAGWFALGADLPAVARQNAPAPAPRPYFLSVGTLEPRKGYATALAAFDLLWERGAQASYVIVGKQGWDVDGLAADIRAHREFGKRLFWMQGVDDAALASLYRDAHALILPTAAEGFGLPLVEAAHFGVPAIVSDIAVFREIAGDQVTYFKRFDARALSNALHDALTSRPLPPEIAPVSWRDSALALFDMTRHARYQSTIGTLRARTARRAEA
ncbi:MAG: glycosyltransferase family 4 protein [Hyphomicrobiales bacterium]|nr:glycosyltransferase family 4 protein [Hyphomicrobiales bacterium]